MKKIKDLPESTDLGGIKFHDPRQAQWDTGTHNGDMKMAKLGYGTTRIRSQLEYSHCFWIDYKRRWSLRS